MKTFREHIEVYSNSLLKQPNDHTFADKVAEIIIKEAERWIAEMGTGYYAEDLHKHLKTFTQQEHKETNEN